MITYKGICDKLGIDLLEYDYYVPDTEDDNDYNQIPLDRLSYEELDFLVDYMMFKKGIIKKDPHLKQ